MKLRINLYGDQLRRKRLPLGRETFLLLVPLVLLAVVVVGAVLQWKNAGLQQQLATQQSHLQAQEKLLLALADQSQRHGPSPALSQRVGMLEEQIRQRKLLIGQIDPLLGQDGMPYSRILEGFVQSHVSGLWLTQLRVQAEQLLLEGYSLNEEAVPQMLQRMAEVEAFQGRQFERLELERERLEGQDVIRFRLGGAATNAGGGDAHG